MKLKIHPSIIIRVPQFSLDSTLTDRWEELKESIRLSSNDFYRVIKDISVSGLDSLPEPLVHSIWKYFNRAKYRSTPYGSFAGVGLLKNSEQNDKTVLIDKEQVLHRFISWPYIDQLTSYNRNLHPDTLIFSNTSFYQVGGNIRYLVKEQSEFHLAYIENNEMVLTILNRCLAPTSVLDLVKLTGTLDLLHEMVDLQLLYTEQEPNIIGADYFTRIGVPLVSDHQSYVLAERKILAGYTDLSKFKYVNQLLNILSEILPEPQSDNLQTFKRMFYGKYEQALVPIMKALDPETGLGYGEFEKMTGQENVIRSLSEKVASKGLSDEFRHLYKVMFNKGTSTEKVIRLQEYFVETAAQKKPQLPNNIGMMCSIIDDQIYLDQFYGPTANRISGRFTLANEKFENHCQLIAAQEQTANPKVIFFDISYNAEVNIDDVNRRKQIYPYQLSLLNFDHSFDPLTLDDLYLTMKGNELHLVSKRLNKRLIPRLSTAYNYSRSDLSLFRFLCDLQFEGLKRNFDTTLSTYFPDLDFYPRLEYHNIIIAPARWRIDYTSVKFKSNFASASDLKTYLSDLGLGRYAVTRTDDRTLCFDTDNPSDLKELLFMLRKYKSFLLEEGFVPEKPIIEDVTSQSYNSELFLTLYHDHEIYKSGSNEFAASPDISDRPQSIFPPGTQWLYFEIFVHPFHSDLILRDKITTVLKKEKGRISHWFFVRYEDNGKHLRLRLKVKIIEDVQPVLTAISDSLSGYVQDEIISNFRLSTYKREIERYGPDLIEETERHFSKDSEYVLNAIKFMLHSFDKYFLCVQLMLGLRDSKLFSIEDFDQIINRTAGSLSQEHNLDSKGYKELNKQYKEYKSRPPVSLNATTTKFFLRFESSLKELLAQCPASRRPRLLADLIHMHVNRLFSDHQRTYELTIYYFIQKDILFKAGQNLRSASAF